MNWGLIFYNYTKFTLLLIFYLINISIKVVVFQTLSNKINYVGGKLLVKNGLSKELTKC